MKLTAVQTPPIHAGEYTLMQLLERFVPNPPPESIIAITSKVIALCERSVAPLDGVSKAELVKKIADYYRASEHNPHGVTVTITGNHLVATAGIDSSNADGQYVLWPKDPQGSANAARLHLRRDATSVGVVITDSHSVPLQRGVSGFALAHSGFAALDNHIGEPDVFGRPLNYSVASVLQGLAAAAVLVMGEAAERTPIVIIEEAPMVEFQDRDPSKAELDFLYVKPKDDIYSELLLGMPWINARNFVVASISAMCYGTSVWSMSIEYSYCSSASDTKIQGVHEGEDPLFDSRTY